MERTKSLFKDSPKTKLTQVVVVVAAAASAYVIILMHLVRELTQVVILIVLTLGQYQIPRQSPNPPRFSIDENYPSTILKRGNGLGGDVRIGSRHNVMPYKL